MTVIPVKAVTARTRILFSLLAVATSSAALTGCQTSIGGQTLPSATYLDDDVQYFPPGPEFPLTNQEDAAKKYRANQQQLQNP